MVGRTRDGAFLAGRALALLRGASRAVVRSRTERELLDEICSLAVQTAGYRMAWIGYARDDARKSVEPVAHAGVNRGYLEAIEVTWGSEPSGRGPTGQAIRSRKPVTVASLVEDENFTPWRDAALERGYAASIAVPIETGEGVIGALNIYAAEVGAFSPEEVQLLGDLGRELAFGIQAVRTREARDRAVERVVESEARTRAIVEAIPDMMFRLDGTGTFLEFVPSKEFPPLVPPEEFLGRELGAVFPPQLSVAAKRDVASVLTTGTTRTREYELTIGGEVRSFEYQMARSGDNEVLAIVRDITERRRAEVERDRTGLFYQTLAEGAPVGVWHADPSGAGGFVNSKLAAIAGMPPEEARGDGWAKALHPDDRDHVHKTWTAYVEGRGDFHISYRFLQPDGSVRWVIGQASPAVAADGTVLGHIGTLTDITEAREREEELRATTGRLNAIIRSSPVAMVLVDTQENVRMWTPAAERMFGWTADEVIGKPIPIVHTERDGAAAEWLKQAWQGADTARIEVVPQRKDGSPFTASVSIGTVSGADGRVIGLLGIFEDVTARRAAERALRESEERLRNIVEHSTNMYYSHGPDHVLTYLSPQVENLLGFPPAEAMRRWTDFLTDDPGNQRGLELTDRAIDTGERQPPYELELLHGSGRRVWVEVREAPVVRDGRTVAMVGSLTDITERRRYEEELRESREALRRLAASQEEAREAERRRVARELHDELGQALTGLKMDVAWLRDRLDESDVSGRERIGESLNLINTTVDAVRRISTELRPGVLDDLGLATAIRWQTREFMRRTDIGVRLDSDDAIPELDSGRATAVFRIFQEALTNVARHASASEITVRIAVEHGQLLLCIEDNGRGATPAEVGSRRSMGILGMRERASTWGGTLAIRRRPGGGTSVELRMPLPGNGGRGAS
ncbi:MAG: PAS domain S-box protein [Gemmatimonadota bacterium]|nr:PAS domain S-box protein [Gemmatimonadota bacterium]